ncbi:sugar phosphate isomerase/epimerase [Agriterribacter sp.]|uniref:sugar phosphate isomerase/epimerase family protein n=1 Tax=Agriterribacter sp. TaxID=2821509 RepID=UPI002BBF3AD9|nr:sugar phosphate isomerase/epimerase [Agriterribacter sp.]HTN09175.1 sugar phosphate isomerase/epimerase [Agriterribacter sp.]
MSSRRKFIQASAIALSVSSLSSFTGTANPLQNPRLLKKEFLQTGMAGYSFVNYTIDQTIAIMNRVAINNLSVKDFHLPLNSSQQTIDEVLTKFKNGSIHVYAVGVIYMKTEAEADRAFDYAKRVGVNLIIGVPGYDLLRYTEKKVKESGIRMAIHNHGPEDKLYPAPGDVYTRISKMDKRMGLCLDIGHAFRAGIKPEKAVIDYAPRIFDLHMKDVTAAKAEGKAIEAGRGAIDFPALVAALRKIKYNGVCSIEFEKDMKDALPGIAESAGYIRGVMS